jgi:hypothetical protein
MAKPVQGAAAEIASARKEKLTAERLRPRLFALHRYIAPACLWDESP